jgi:hypothetical protein
MPVEFPTYGGEGDPRPALRAFVLAVRDLLEELARTNADPQGRPLFYLPLLADLRAAWAEAKPAFDVVAGRIENISDQSIAEHGLSGNQLKFKLNVIRFIYERYLSVGKGIIKKLLDIIDDLLKSILDAIGGGGAVEEIKDFIKDSVDEET